MIWKRDIVAGTPSWIRAVKIQIQIHGTGMLDLVELLFGLCFAKWGVTKPCVSILLSLSGLFGSANRCRSSAHKGRNNFLQLGPTILSSEIRFRIDLSNRYSAASLTSMHLTLSKADIVDTDIDLMPFVRLLRYCREYFQCKCGGYYCSSNTLILPPWGLQAFTDSCSPYGGNRRFIRTVPESSSILLL